MAVQIAGGVKNRAEYRAKRGFYHAEDIIKVITGIRRCGKSSLMMTIVEELEESGVDDSNIIYTDGTLSGI